MKKLLTASVAFFCLSVICFAEEEPINKVLKCNDSTNICTVRDKRLNYGLADKNNNIVIPMEYTNITLIKNEDNYLLEKKIKTGEFVYGVADSKGKITIPAKYHSIVKTNITGKYKFQPTWDFKYGLIDGATGNIDIEPVYSHFYKLNNGDFKVEKDIKKEGIIDKDFKITIPAEYYNVFVMNGDNYYTIMKEVSFYNNDGILETKFKYGIADRTGKIIVPVECSWIEHGIASFNYSVTKNGKTYVFDSKTGELKLKG